MTHDFPVLSAGPTPHTPPGQWSFSLVGEIDEPRRWTREVQHAGGDAALIFAADKISKVRELAHLVRGDQARPVRSPPERLHDRRRLEHYHESLRMLRRITAEHPLVTRLADELENVR